MKILQISSAPVTYLGGTEKVILELSKEISKKHDVTILQTNLYESKKHFEKNSQIGKVKIITCKNNYFIEGFGYSKEFKKKLEEIWRNFDVVHIHGHGRFTSNWALKFLKDKKPIIYTAHGFFHSRKSGRIKKIYNKFFGKRLNNATYCTALTELEKNSYLKLGVRNDKIKIIPNWVDLKNNKLLKISRRKIISSFGLDPNLKTLLYVGRIHESKGLSYVLKAIRNIKINLLIVGRDGGYMSQLKEEIVDLGLQKRVAITGPISGRKLKEIYSSSDFFILFSEWEGFGIVVIEAMAYGLPIIVSNQGALPYIVCDGKTGLIVPFGNVPKLSEKVKEYLSEPSFAKKISSAAGKFVESYDIKKIVRKYEELYEDAKKHS